jgi:FkbM family methyltransferase
MSLSRSATRALRPVYAAYLNAVYGRRGMPWTINGDRLRIDPRLRWMLPHENEPLLYEYLRVGVTRGQTVLDIGAFLGTYAIAEARWVGSTGRVMAVEPTPWTFERLRRHIVMNAVQDRCDIRCAAVGAVNGHTALRLYDEEPYRNELVNDGAAGAVKVEMITVDELCRRWGRLPDWIRMDVQGREFEVLAGARELIRARRGRLQIIVEVHPEQWAERGIGGAEATDRFAELGLKAAPLPGAPPLYTQSAHVVMEHMG